MNKYIVYSEQWVALFLGSVGNLLKWNKYEINMVL